MNCKEESFLQRSLKLLIWVVPHFVLDAKKANRGPYAAETLLWDYYTIKMHLSVDNGKFTFFTGPRFHPQWKLPWLVDRVMKCKELTAGGICMKMKQFEIFPKVEEERWDGSLLKLLETVLYDRRMDQLDVIFAASSLITLAFSDVMTHNPQTRRGCMLWKSFPNRSVIWSEREQSQWTG